MLAGTLARPRGAPRVGLALAAPVALALALRAFAFEPFEVASESMLPTLEAGDHLFVNKLARPRRGDVVVFERGGERFVKRVVGLPGERVEIRAGRVLVNGVAADEWPTGTRHRDAEGRSLSGSRELTGAVEHAVLDDPAAERPDGATVVPAGHYFVLGDNRDHSSDSRDFGPIAAERVVGVVAHVWGRGPRFERERTDGE